jgi:2-polyprenyl-3-methyl-5-hydroxy-6-metoxy-1,4-benzoquinol methylase
VYVERLGGAGTITRSPRGLDASCARETLEPEGPPGPVTATTTAHPTATRSRVLEVAISRRYARRTGRCTRTRANRAPGWIIDHVHFVIDCHVQAAPRADMSEYDRDSWEQRWTQALRTHGDRVAQRPPNAHLIAQVSDLRPGRALDAGCGHGSDTLWLAARGWQVTAVDFAATALAFARSTAEAMGPDVAERIDWIEADLATWTPQRGEYDLVVCLYVHVAGSVEEMVRRMAAGVAPGGTLFLVGHRPIDPATGAATAAAGQVQVSVEAALAALDPIRWEVIVAEERPRAMAGTGVDAVICARRIAS